MSLESGTKLAIYEILGLLGAGGMGEVYRAKDTKLGRDVAIKVLPEAFAKTKSGALGSSERHASLRHSIIQGSRRSMGSRSQQVRATS